MALSRIVNSEVSDAFRLLLSSVRPLRAAVDQRSDFHLCKAGVYEFCAVADPGVAAQALAQANTSRREAHAIALDC